MSPVKSTGRVTGSLAAKAGADALAVGDRQGRAELLHDGERQSVELDRRLPLPGRKGLPREDLEEGPGGDMRMSRFPAESLQRVGSIEGDVLPALHGEIVPVGGGPRPRMELRARDDPLGVQRRDLPELLERMNQVLQHLEGRTKERSLRPRRPR